MALGGRTRAAAAVALPAIFTGVVGSGETNLQETNALLWVMIGISVAGAIVTFAFLAYSVIKFRDPNNKRRRYG
jgi:hypothetical protein